MGNRTTLIISELSKQQTLTVPSLIKAEIAHFKENKGLNEDIVQHWTELAGLGRIVVILNTPEVAHGLFSHLRERLPDLKIHLSEPILPRHKSFDRSLNVQVPESPEPEKYSEPKPIFQKEAHTPTSEKKVLLESLTLDTSAASSLSGNLKVEDGYISPVSPSITLEQVQDK